MNSSVAVKKLWISALIVLLTGCGGSISTPSPATPPADTTAPSTPTSPQANSVQQGSVTITWSASSDNVAVAGYRVFRNSSQIGTTPQTSYSDSAVSPGTTYSYAVAAFDAAGNVSPMTTPISVTTLPDTTAPSVPAGLQATSVRPTSIILSWTASTDNAAVAGYKLYRGGAVIATLAQTAYTDTGLTPSTGYSYSVAAFDAAGNLSALSSALAVTTAADASPPSVPGGLQTSSVQQASVTIAWSPSSDDVAVAGYRVFRNNSQIGTTAQTSYTDTTVSPGATYTYAVAAFDAAGNVSPMSTPLSVTTLPDTTAPSIPSGLQATSVQLTSIALSWTASTDNVAVAGYKLYRGGTQIATPTQLTYTDTGLTPATSYSYTLAAFDAAGNVSAMTLPLAVATLADTTAPSVPANLQAVSLLYNGVTMTWSPSTDNVAVTGYKVLRNGAVLATVGQASYSDGSVAAATSYSYTVEAVDAAGNLSAPSAALAVMTPAAPDTTPPSAPSNLQTVSVSPSSAAISWSASTDNTGVTGYRVFRNAALVGTVTQTSYGDSGLTPSTSYSYTVQALDAAGNASAPSAPLAVTTPADTTPPTVPANLQATSVLVTSAGLSWSASTDNVAVAGYRVFRNGIAVATVTQTAYTDNNLTPATSYTFAVAAFDAAGNTSALSAALPVTTPADAVAPSVPAGLQAPSVQVTSVGLSWNASTDNVAVTAYRIFRNGVLVGTVAQTAYTDSGLAPATAYSYAVAAVDAAGNASASSSALAVTTLADTTAPTTPTNLQSSSTQVTSVTLTWSASTDNVGVTGYKVFRNSTLIATVVPTTFTDTNLTPGTAYNYSVAAVDAAGNVSTNTASLPVTTLADTTPPSTPTNLQATSVQLTSIALSWTASTDNVAVTGYRVFRNAALLATVTQTAYTDSNLAPGTAYSYTVAAIDAAGNASTPTAALPVTTVVDVAPPSIPAGLQATSVLESSVTLSWTASTDNVAVSGYKVLRNSSVIASVTQTTYTDANLIPSTAYAYAVEAFDSSANTSVASAPPLVVTTLPDSTPPSVPANLQATSVQLTSVTLAWSASTDNVAVAAYKLFRDGGLIASPLQSPYIDSGRTPGTTYNYTIQAVDTAGNSSALSAPLPVSTPHDVTPPSTPANLQATSVLQTSATIAWSASTDDVAVTGYKIFRNNSLIATISQTVYTDAGLAQGASYSYTVSAFDAAGNNSPATAPLAITTSPFYPVKQSANKHYLVDQNNNPFLMAGDAAHSLLTNLTEAQAETFFANRQSHGVNTAWVEVLCDTYTGGRSDGTTYDGLAPFTTPGDLSTPNPAYFQRLDDMVNIAARHNVTLMLDSIDTAGWINVIESNSQTAHYNYGVYLGTRYKSFKNIIWITGNDFRSWGNDPVANGNVAAIMHGLADSDPNHLRTSELSDSVSGSLDDPQLVPYTTLAGAYTYFPTYAEVLDQYNAATAANLMPVFMEEATYEFATVQDNFGDAQTLRRSNYWTMLSGASGLVYGNYYIWPFNGPESFNDWTQYLDTPGIVQLQAMANAFAAYPWWNLVPDQTHTFVTAGYGTFSTSATVLGNNYVTAALTPDGKLGMAYLPGVTTITVDMTKFTGAVTARWLDPANGTYTPATGSPFTNAGTLQFTSPHPNSAGDADWVLVLQVQ